MSGLRNFSRIQDSILRPAQSGIVAEIDRADTSVVRSWWVGFPWLTDSSDMHVKKFEVIDDQTITMLIYHDLIYDVREGRVGVEQYGSHL
jgi:hypothetical protein